MAGAWIWLAGAAGGAGAGAVLRWLLARLRRGTSLPPGPLEAVTALLTAIGAGLLVGRIGWLEALPVLWLGVFGTALAAIDLRHHRLPDALTLPGSGVSLGIVALAEPGSLPRALAAAAAGAVVLAVPALLSPASMGWGDVKLMLSLGALTGQLSWTALLLAVCAGFVLAAVVALAGIALRVMTMKSNLAFGPFLVAGSWLVLLALG